MGHAVATPCDESRVDFTWELLRKAVLFEILLAAAWNFSRPGSCSLTWNGIRGPGRGWIWPNGPGATTWAWGKSDERGSLIPGRNGIDTETASGRGRILPTDRSPDTKNPNLGASSTGPGMGPDKGPLGPSAHDAVHSLE